MRYKSINKHRTGGLCLYGIHILYAFVNISAKANEEEIEIGVWGQRHLEYIKSHRKGFYTSLILDCKLNRYLADINKQAEEMFDTLISQYKTAEGITEQLKADNQLEWVSQMNNIRQRATEIVNNDIIYN